MTTRVARPEEPPRHRRPSSLRPPPPGLGLPSRYALRGLGFGERPDGPPCGSKTMRRLFYRVGPVAIEEAPHGLTPAWRSVRAFTESQPSERIARRKPESRRGRPEGGRPSMSRRLLRACDPGCHQNGSSSPAGRLEYW